MNSQATLERLLRIMVLLNNNFGRSASELATSIDGISDRSIYRYIGTLREVGFVIDKFDNKYYRIDWEETSPRLRQFLCLMDTSGNQRDGVFA